MKPIMMKNAIFGGVNTAVMTAFRADLSIDADLTARHCRWLLANGCDHLAVLGTTGEANSLGIAERMRLLDDLAAAGLDAGRLFPGTASTSITDTVALTRHAAKLGCRGVLLLPPFYYKEPSEDGLYAFYSEVIERVGGAVKVYFYHFPQQSAVPITVSLIARLLKSYPDTVKGIKDSTGDIPNTRAYIDAFAADGFEVYTGADARLQEALKLGAAGCITATSNVTSRLAARICAAPDSADADAAQALLAKARAAVGRAQTIPAVKTIAAHLSGVAAWTTLRPPHRALAASEAAALVDAWDSCATGLSIAY
jgi:4-hydroxy-tetrahydrodipicolinate synthase